MGSLQRIGRNISKQQRNGQRTIHQSIFNPGDPPMLHIISDHCILFAFVEWHHQYESGSSRTSRFNCIRLVVFAHWSLLHMRVKTTISRLACRWYEHVCQQNIDIFACSDDVHAVLKDGKSFIKFCPDWKNTSLWKEWVNFGVKCFSKGWSMSHLNVTIFIYDFSRGPSEPSTEGSLKDKQDSNTDYITARWTSRDPICHWRW